MTRKRAQLLCGRRELITLAVAGVPKLRRDIAIQRRFKIAQDSVKLDAVTAFVPIVNLALLVRDLLRRCRWPR